MSRRTDRANAAVLDEREIVCVDEESAKAEAARQQAQESNADLRWNHVVRDGRWVAKRYRARPKPLWRSFVDALLHSPTSGDGGGLNL